MNAWFHSLKWFVVVLLVAALSGHAVAEESFEGWNLEPGLAQAHLVMVARVTHVSNIKIVEGAKTDVAIREYRFQPVRKLKGLFQRDQLSMTGADLGLATEDATSAPPLKEGEFRLLILAQQQGRSMGCVSATPGATTFAERVPLLTGPDDPLIGVVETLIQVSDSRSRRERAALLVSRLETVKGLAAVPILSSLKLRADWAAADARTLAPLTQLTRDPAPAIRNGALETLRDILASRIKPANAKTLNAVTEALREILASEQSSSRLRLTALEALGHALAMNAEAAWAGDMLRQQLTSARTHAERAAAATALSYRVDPQSAAAVLDALAKLPLDEQPVRVAVFARAAVRLDRAGAEKVLLARLAEAIRSRQPLEAEVDALARLESKVSLPLLLSAATVATVERPRIAAAFGRLGDEQAVPVLAGWLRADDYTLREAALTALETLDTPTAAREARPMLKTEAHLPFKLRIARLLARHDINDGYALATEHLADAAQTASAALVLAAMKDARTVNDLSAIVAAKPDRRWLAAALTGLAATGNADARKQLLVILSDDRNPLTADAAEAAGIAADVELLNPLAKLVQSRNRHIARASLAALRRYFTNASTSPRGLAKADDDDDAPPPNVNVPEATRDALAAAVAAIVTDAYVDADLRREAFTVAKLLRGKQFSKLLTDVADLAELEGMPLLSAVESERLRNSSVK